MFVVDTDDNRIRKIDANGIITTLAASAEVGSSATNDEFIRPAGLAVDATGNVYFADYQSHRIRKIDGNGTITTVAGTATQGFSGDGGPAVNARLNYPTNVTIDGAGNLFIADTQNNRIRKISANGIITTVAGNGVYGFGGDGGLAINAPFRLPNAVAVDADNNLFIADTQNNRIRKVDANGIVTTVAGNGALQSGGDGGPAVNASLNNPNDIAVDAAGTLYITQQDHRIRKVTPAGTILPVAGNGTNGFSGDGGLAVNALVSSSTGVDTDAAGNVYIADRENYRIRRIMTDGTITTVTGGFTGDGGMATNAFFRRNSFNTPANLTVDVNGNIYVVDRFANRVRQVTPSGTITTVAGTGVNGYTGDGGLATNAQLNNPTSVALDAAGNLYIADLFNNRVRRVDASGIISTVAGNGAQGYGGENVSATGTPLSGPYEVAFDATGAMYITESNLSRVRKVDRDGLITTAAGTGARGFSGDGGLATNARLAYPNGIAVDAAGNLYIADSGNRRVRKVTYPIQPMLTASGSTNCSTTSVTITATPTGPGFAYQFGPGATQIGATNRATVSAAGVYSVTVTTSVFGSPAGSATVTVSNAASTGSYTVKAGNWNDPAVWACGQIPTVGQPARILHQIDVPPNYQAEARDIRHEAGGSLRFATDAKLRLAP